MALLAKLSNVLALRIDDNNGLLRDDTVAVGDLLAHGRLHDNHFQRAHTCDGRVANQQVFFLLSHCP